jgi:hypothetical protein
MKKGGEVREACRRQGGDPCAADRKGRLARVQRSGTRGRGIKTTTGEYGDQLLTHRTSRRDVHPD